MTADGRSAHAPVTTTVSAGDPDRARQTLLDTHDWHMYYEPPAAPPVVVLSTTDAGIIATSRGNVDGEMAGRTIGDDSIIVGTLHTGHAELQDLGKVTRIERGDVYLASQPGDDRLAWSWDVQVSTVVLPSWLLREVAGAAPAAPIRFDRDPLPTAVRSTWRNQARFVNHLLADPHIATAELAVGHASRMLSATALGLFPNSLTAPDAPHDCTDATSRTLAAAIAFIDSHADRDITLAQVAAAACVGPRAVQLAFRRHRDTTPLRYLRTVRLDRARAALMAADPTAGATVTEIAARWGFGHQGRFAAQYRRVYGELPSTTLYGR